MIRLILLIFLITFTFILNEVFVFGQVNRSLGKNKQKSNLRNFEDQSNPDSENDLINNVEDAEDKLDPNASVVLPLEMNMLRYFKEQLEGDAGSDIEGRIEDLLNVLDKCTDMFCVADENNLNDRADVLNLRLNELLNQDPEAADAQRLRDELRGKEKKLRSDIIKAIDRVLKTGGRCDNTPPKGIIPEE